ncbi:siderophore-interacting protein [Rathayibacter soli]|uniref:siderophore-interacting protein n=1 Tax=Rathayibacter soli TaxID=3144168 RepID=UPI0027E43A4C|nr:siderophore-interacting protein [Glaciibacter superstes]
MKREHVRHELTVRHLRVLARRELTPSMVRITLGGTGQGGAQQADGAELAGADGLDGFASLGPSDHVKVFFPDPATGIVTAPSISADGVHRPTDGIVISRDYTPRAFRAAADGVPAELDVDFVLHGAPGSRAEAETADGGPASAWAAAASVGDPLAIAGPRGSRLAPDDAAHAVLIADETALPAFSRWLELLPATTRITAILDVANEDTEHYLTDAQRARASIEWTYREDGSGQLEESVRSLGPIDSDTYVWAAGEATTLVPVRRHLRRTLGLDHDQLTVEGYWRRGITNLDHHAPIDPSDPD